MKGYVVNNFDVASLVLSMIFQKALFVMVKSVTAAVART